MLFAFFFTLDLLLFIRIDRIMDHVLQLLFGTDRLLLHDKHVSLHANTILIAKVCHGLIMN